MSDLVSLQKILEKDPIIYTFQSKEIIFNPEKVESNYQAHADTHMSLADTSVYFERLLNGLAVNKSTFVGGVSSDYGLGKTSILVYFWRQLSNKGILAIPPYWWENFNENFKCVNSWTKYIVGKINSDLLFDIEEIYKKYVEPSIEAEAINMVDHTDSTYDKAYQYAKRLFDDGKLNLGLTPLDFINYLEDLTKLLVNEKGLFKGIIVFQDEFQRTVEKNTLDSVAGILFDISSSLCERNGMYGFMVGMPTQTQSALAKERSDIFDRLEKYKCFINLEEMYGANFAPELWDNYSEHFNFEEMSHKIVDKHTLAAVGQITDSKRKDLGNGPRSVISAFNRIVDYYLRYKQTYSVKNLVEDLIQKEIVLGERSTYLKRLSSILEMPIVDENPQLKEAISILAAFPKSCSFEIIKQYNCQNGLDELVKTATGEIIREVAGGYVLITLMDPGSKKEQSAIETRFTYFRSRYNPDKKHANRAMNAFREFVIPKIFQTKNWKDGSEFNSKDFHWHTTSDNVSYCLAKGSFVRGNSLNPFPSRVLQIFVSDSQKLLDKQKEAHMSLYFNLDYTNRDSKGYLKFFENELSKVLFKVNLLSPIEKFNIPFIDNDFISSKMLSPFFVLSLVEFLSNESNIPKSETENLKHLIDTVIDKMILQIFDDEFKSTNNSDFVLSNGGRYLFEDIYFSMCEKLFSNYSTLIVSEQWSKKLQSYIAILENENISLNKKRGKEPLVNIDINNEEARKQAKIEVSKLLGISRSNLDVWAQQFTNLIDISKAEQGKTWLKVHPLEEHILEAIENSKYTIKENGVICKSADLKYILEEAINMGYLYEEILFIIQKLGVNRKFFNFKEHKGKNIIYRVPVSIDELKETLIEKFQNLKSEFTILNNIEGFDKTFDFDKADQEIDSLDTEEMFESLKQRIHAQFEINHRWINITIESWKDQLQNRKKKFELDLSNYENKDFKIINLKLDANISWASAVYKCQLNDFTLAVEDLKQSLEAIKNKYKEIEQIITEVNNNIGYNYKRIADIEEKYDLLKNDMGLFDSKFSVLKEDISNLRKWHKLASEADEVLKLCMKAKQLGRIDFYDSHESLASEIDKHINKYRKAGLKNYEQFDLKYNELKKECMNFTMTYRKAFLAEKEKLGEYVKKFGAESNSILRIQFSDVDPNTSYKILYEEVESIITNIIESLKQDIFNLSNDIEYIEKILKKESEIKEYGLDKLISRILRESTIISFQEEMCKDEDKLNEVLDNYEKVRVHFNEILKQYRKLQQPGQSNTKEEQLLSLLERNVEKDFKEIILQYSNNNNEDLDLDNTLDLLKSLFMKNILAIKIKRI